MARRVRARCPNDVRAREETTSGAVVVLAKGDVTDKTGDDDFKKKGKWDMHLFKEYVPKMDVRGLL